MHKLTFLVTADNYYVRINNEAPVKMCFEGVGEVLTSLFTEFTDNDYEDLEDFEMILSSKKLPAGQAKKYKYYTVITKKKEQDKFVHFDRRLYSKFTYTAIGNSYSYEGSDFYRKIKENNCLMAGDVDIFPLIKDFFDFDFFWDKTHVYACG